MNSSKENLKHWKWEFKYHVVFIPKCRLKVMYGLIRQELGSIPRELAQQKESEVVEGHLMADHVHMMLMIPPKYSVSGVVGYIKGKVRSREGSWTARRTLWGCTFGPEGTRCRRWGGMKSR